MIRADSHSAVKALRKKILTEKQEPSSLFSQYVDFFLKQSSLLYLTDLPPDTLRQFFIERFARLKQRFNDLYLIHVTAGGGQNGGEAYTLIEVLTHDRPFLTDSVLHLLAEEGLVVRAMFHPIMPVRRSAAGKLLALEQSDTANFTVQLVLVVQACTPSFQAGLRRRLAAVLSDVICCVQDYPLMQAKMDELQATLAADPTAQAHAELLRWIRGGNYIFLGLMPFGAGRRENEAADGMALKPHEKAGLGLLKMAEDMMPHHRRIYEQAAAYLKDHARKEPFLAVEETDVVSNVHKRKSISCLLFSPQSIAKGNPAWVIVGMFTNRSQHEDVLNIPIIKEKIGTLLKSLGLVTNSFWYKEIIDFLNGLPKFELFRLSSAELKQLAEYVLSLTDYPHLSAKTLVNKKWQSLRVLTAIPSSYFAPDQMRKIRFMLDAFLGRPAANTFVMRLSNFSIFGLMYRPLPPSWQGAPQQVQVENLALEILQTREDHLLGQARKNQVKDETLCRCLLAALPEDYKIAHTDAEILSDLEGLEQMVKTQTRQLDLRGTEDPATVQMVLYDWEFSSLSRIMPILTNLRLHVVEEKAFELAWEPAAIHIQFFRVQTNGENIVDRTEILPRLRRLLFGMLSHELENDPLNALLFTCDFDWRQINLMMMLRNYLVQVGTVYTKHTMNETLIRRKVATQALYAVFAARFDPAIASKKRAQLQAAGEVALADAMRDIDNLTEDRIYKRLLNLVCAAVRTNYYQDDDAAVCWR